MAKLDGYDVRRGDTVHDLVFGAGVVQHLYADGRGAVSFGLVGGMERTFDFNTGVMTNAATRTLYWSQPFIVPPPKERAKYDAFQTVAQALASLVIR